MLFRNQEWTRIRTGEVTVAFRRWRRPTVVSGGTLRTPVGVLAIDSVDRIEADEIGDEDAKRAGYPDAATLKAELDRRVDGVLYRIRFHVKGPDPRIALRERGELDDVEWEAVRRRLERMDRASRTGPWTRDALEAVAAGEGVRAGDLAPSVGQQKDAFKTNVRKLKNLGLTESLGTGYRVSPRGRAVLARLDAEQNREGRS